jgi:hypothetical protein
MSTTRPMTSQEIDDGWILETEASGPPAYESYELIEDYGTSEAFSEAYAAHPVAQADDAAVATAP